MASGTINGSTSNAYIESAIDWSATPINEKNESSVTASLWYRRTNIYSGTPTSGTGTFTLVIDGKSESATVKITVPNNGAWVKVMEITKSVSHDQDGTKSITISASGGISGTSLSSTDCSGTAELDDIPRKAIVTDAQNFNDEGNPTVTFTNVGGFQLIPYLCFYLDGEQIIEITRAKGSYISPYTWSLTEDERKTLRELLKYDNSCGVTEGFYTYSGDKELGYNSIGKTFSIVNSNPVFTDEQVTYADTNTDVTDVTDNPLYIVQNQSTLAVTFEDATAKKEATITKYEITVNGTTKTVTKSGTVDFGKINTSANCEISIKAIDSRGNSTTVIKTVEILPWSLPVFTASLERKNNYENTTYLTVNASISSVNNKNTMKISYWCKEYGGDYTTDKPIPIENKTETEIDCDKNKAFKFSITVEDKFDSVTTEFDLSKGKFPLFIDTRKNAVGINDFPAEDEALRVAEGVAHFMDGVKINNETVVDYIIEQDTDGIWTYRRWASGIAECWGLYSITGAEITAPWGYLFETATYYDVSFPTGLFISNPVANFSVPTATGGVLALETMGETTKDKTCSFFPVRPTAQTLDLTIAIRVIGRWKGE